jgi:hypothetical protein
MHRSITFAALFIAVSGLRATAEELSLPLNLKIEAAQEERVDARVTYRLPVPANGRALRLVETTGGRETPVPTQLDAETLWWIAAGKTPAAATRMYRLAAGSSSAAAPQITIADSGQAVEASFDSKPLLRYNKAHVEPPPGVNKRHGRSAHLHPVWTPRGTVVTDELPPDHLHQSGIFLAYTKTVFEGRGVDFWNLGGGQGRVRFKQLDRIASGPVFGEIQVQQEHVDLLAGDEIKGVGAVEGGKVALNETWNIRVWNAGWQSGYWLLDITSRSVAATNNPLRMPEYHYGGMAIRGARPWTPDHVHFLTSAGDNRRQGNHTRVRWCDMTGVSDGQTAGATLMTHPDNFRFPEPLRIHPTMPYMVYTPSFVGAWEIQPGRDHFSRYQFVIHDGELEPATLERLWRDFASPLVATPAD